MGLSSTVGSKDRDTLLRYLNEAARELYDQCDMVGVEMEMVFKVNGDQTITCPYYVGPIRGVRELNSMQVWHINKMRPRYNQFNWTDMWRNIRLKNCQALQTAVTNESVGVITVPFVENPPIQVTVVGPTATGSNTSEVVIMDSVSKETVNQFIDYVTVAKDRINNYDVTLSDVDGKVLTAIPNCMIEAIYQIIDISSCPWLSQNTSALDNYLEVLYKKALTILYNDSDSFPSKTNYDDILVNKMMQLSKEEQDKIEVAQTYDAKATRGLARKVEDQNKSTEDMISLVANAHDTMIPRIGSNLRRGKSLFSGRRY